MTLDWGDIALHAAVASVVLANGWFWISREYNQKPDKWRLFTSPQSFLEWFVPSICIPILGYFVLSWAGIL